MQDEQSFETKVKRDIKDAVETLLSISQQTNKLESNVGQNQPENDAEQLGTPPQSEDELETNSSCDELVIEDSNDSFNENNKRKHESELARVCIINFIIFF